MIERMAILLKAVKYRLYCKKAIRCTSVIRKLFKHILVKSKHIGKNVKAGITASLNLRSEFEGNNRIAGNSSFSGKMGRCTYIGECSTVSGVIGRYTSIGSNVNTISGRHPVTMVSTSPMFYASSAIQCGKTYVSKDKFNEHVYYDEKKKYRVKIGNDVWIGSHVVLMPGIEIGDGAVIGAGAVVTKDVPPYAIVGGVPAKVIRYRFTDEEIKIISESKWWDWPEEKIRQNADKFESAKDFISFVQSQQ